MSQGPLLVEVTGVAGAGKSTLVDLLCRDAGFRRADSIHARDPGHLLHIARSIPRLLPILVRNLRPGPRLSWADVKLLVYATGWHRVLARRAGSGGGVTLLDQGPIYALVRLTAKDARVTRSPRFRRLRDATLDAWAGRLGTVVWLDAEDAVLWRRINHRVQPHGTKGARAEVGRAFIVRYRELFEELLGRMQARGRPRILRFDTGATPSERIAAQVREALMAGVGR